MTMNNPGIQTQIVRPGETAPQREPEPLLEVTVRLYGLDRGQARVEFRPNFQGNLGELEGLRGAGQARAQAWTRFRTVLQREIEDAVALISGG